MKIGKIHPTKNSILIICLLFITTSFVRAQICILGELTQKKQTTPGSTYNGNVIVENLGEEPKDIKIYQTDYFFTADGSNRYDEPGSSPRSNAPWISFSPKQLTIQPHERIRINYEVSVPDDGSLIGTYWSMLMVEGLPEIATEKPQGNITLRFVTRYAIQMITNIEESGISRMKFLNPMLKKEENINIFSIDMENVGERMLRPNIWIELYNLEGKTVGTFEGSPVRIFPGTSSRRKIELINVPSGTYKALVVADCGDENLFGANYTIEIEE